MNAQDLNPYAPPASLEPTANASGAPHTLTEILVKSITLYIQHAPKMLGLILAIWIPLQLVLGYVEFFALDPEAPRSEFGFSYWFDGAVGMLLVGGITSITHAILSGGNPSVGRGLGSAFLAWPRLLGARIVATLAILLAFAAFIVPGIYVGTRAAMADQVAVLELTNPMRSMERSFQLTKGAFWRYFLLLTLYLCVVFVILTVVSLVTELLPSVEYWLVQTLQSLTLYLIVGWITVALTVAYWATIEEDRLLNSHLLGDDQPEPPA